MTPASLLIFVAVCLVLIALRDLRSDARQRRATRNMRSREIDSNATIPAWMGALPRLGGAAAADRLSRAGGAGGMSLRGLAVARIATAATGLAISLPLTALLPPRLGPLVLFAAGGIGLTLPDLVLEWMALRRRQAIIDDLPGAIDVLAITSGGGRSIRAAIGDLQKGGSGALSRELAITVAELESGTGLTAALAELRGRIPAAELAALTLAIERSARLGSPLVEELHRQSLDLREEARRRVIDRAARAAPKIQLVIALILVPSVLLLIAAALVANADRLLAL